MLLRVHECCRVFQANLLNLSRSGRVRQPLSSTQRQGPRIQVVYFVVAMSSCVGIIVFIPFGFSTKNHKCDEPAGLSST